MPDAGSKPILSIVMVYRDRVDHLRLALECLKRQTRPKDQWELILSDYGSVDEKEAGNLLDEYPEINSRSVYTDEKGEWCNAAAKNIGVREAKGYWLLLLNPDNWLAPDTLDVVAERRSTMMRAPGATQAPGFILQGQRWDLSAEATGRILAARSSVLWWNEIVRHFLLGWDADVQANLTRHGRTAYGDFQFMRRKEYWEIGGYDEEFKGWGGDDEDFVDRAKTKGFLIMWIGDDPGGGFRIVHPHHERDRSAQKRNWDLLQRKRRERAST